ncbi:MAG: hypothetical protein ABIP74_04895 [Candidatus Saccharimonas sp.]
MAKREVYEDIEVTQGVSPFISMSRRDIIDVLVCGAGVGLFIGILYLLLDNFVFGAVLCHSQEASDCTQAPQYAMIVATVIGAIAGLVALARARVYRPLFVVLFATICLWIANVLVAGYAWYWTLVTLFFLYAIAYLLFAWLARLRSFVLASVVAIVVLVVVRLVATL